MSNRSYTLPFSPPRDGLQMECIVSGSNALNELSWFCINLGRVSRGLLSPSSDSSDLPRLQIRLLAFRARFACNIRCQSMLRGVQNLQCQPEKSEGTFPNEVTENNSMIRYKSKNCHVESGFSRAVLSHENADPQLCEPDH